MGKLFGIVVAGILALSSSVFAGEQYFKIDTEFLKAQNKNIMEIQPMDEILGSSSQAVKLGWGYSYNGDPLGMRAGLYGTAGNEQEFGIGLDFQVDFKSMSFFGLTPFLGGDVGVGMRNDSGKTKNLSTSVDKVSYISTSDLSTLRTPTVATMDKDSSFFRYGFQLGVNYNISKQLLGYLAYTYTTKTYDVSYRTAAAPNVLNDITFDQRSNGVMLGLTYKF